MSDSGLFDDSAIGKRFCHVIFEHTGPISRESKVAHRVDDLRIPAGTGIIGACIAEKPQYHRE
jgi:hypothetical protein